VVERGARWVEPRLVTEVAFSNWTAEGRLRHPSFLGLRPDKASSDVGREECGPFPGAR
jgi:bifunctional non-homologous end joining protein LigD